MPKEQEELQNKAFIDFLRIASYAYIIISVVTGFGIFNTLGIDSGYNNDNWIIISISVIVQGLFGFIFLYGMSAIIENLNKIIEKM